MVDLVIFYGTLMRPFNRARPLRVADHLVYMGRGAISAVLFDLGIYPAAVPASDATAWGEGVDVARHQPAAEAKGVSFCELKVCQQADGQWLAQAVVDV